MALIMQSSDNGFVDAAAKIVRFPNQVRPASVALRQEVHAALDEYQLGGAAISSCSAKTDIVYMTKSPQAAPPLQRTQQLADPALGNWSVISDSAPAPATVGIHQFTHTPFALSNAHPINSNGDAAAPAIDIAFFDQLNCFGVQILTAQAAVFTDCPSAAPRQTLHIQAEDDVNIRCRLMNQRRRRIAA